MPIDDDRGTRGEMARRVVEFDWSATPLGGRDEWPAHLRSIVDVMLGHGFPMILLWGKDLVQIYNDGYAAIMREKHPAGLGQPTAECWPEVWHINAPIYDRVWQGDTVTFEDKPYPLKRGSMVEDTWLTLTYCPVRGADGMVDGILVTMLDTSLGQRARIARDASEAERQASEQRLALAFKLLPVGVAIVDRSGDVVMSNDVMKKYLPGDRIPSLDDANVGRWRGWHADGRPIERTDFSTARALRGEVVVPGIEFLFEADDGSERWTRVASAPMFDPQGEVSGALSIVIDIDDLKQSAERIRINEERFRQFASASSNILWIRSAVTLAMEFASPAFETIYGLPVADALGDVRHWAAHVVPDDRQTVLRNLDRVRAGESLTQEFRIQRQDEGGFRWIMSTDFPLYDAEGNVHRVAGIATDVTETRRAHEHQQILLAELQHRVRNIMAMLGSLVTRSRLSADTVDEYARLLSGRLMSLARTQALLTQAANAGVSVHALAEQELKAQAHSDAQYDLAGPDLTLPAKATEVLSLALHELTTNALKYGALSREDGHVSLRWKVEPQDGRPWLRMEWRERHPAPAGWFPPQRCGFGTSLIEQRVPYELGGIGRIAFEATGAVASIEFPLMDGSSILQTQAPVPVRVEGGSNDLHGRVDLRGHRILVLDDDFYLANDTAAALRSAGAAVLGPFSDTASALDALDVPPTGAVLDINLGGGASFVTAERLAGLRVPFVFVTGYDPFVLPEALRDAPVLQKPTDAGRIVQALAACLPDLLTAT